MSLYREARGDARGGFVAGAIALVIGLGAGYAIGSSSTEEPSLADSISALRGDLAPVTNGLDLLGGEYPQGVKGGEIVAQTEYDGSVSNVERISSTFSDHAAELEQLDPKGTANLGSTLDELQQAVGSRASTDEVNRLRAEASSNLNEILPAPGAP